MESRQHETSAYLWRIEPLAAVSFLCLVGAPYAVSLARLRPYAFESGLFLAGPIIALLVSLPAAIWSQSKKVLRLRNSILIALAATCGAIVPTIQGDTFAFLKSVSMLLIACVIPMTLSLSFGGIRSIYLIFTANCLMGGVFLAGSVVAPEALFVPTRETYTPTQLGWFANPNMMGATALTVAGSAYALYRDQPWKWTSAISIRYLGVCLLLLCGIAIIRSQSRGSMAAGLILLTLAVLNSRTSRKKLLLFALPGALLIVAILFPEVLVRSQQPALSMFAYKHGETSLSGGRWALWTNLLTEWWNDSPFFGGGLMGSTALSISEGVSGAHNAYIKILIDLGIVGGALIGIVMVNIARGLRSASLEGKRVGGLTICLIAICAHSMVENHVFALATTVSGLIFWQAAAGIGRGLKIWGKRCES